jgi:hypothetical protein
VVGVQFGSEELRFADNAQGRPSLGALEANWRQRSSVAAVSVLNGVP